MDLEGFSKRGIELGDYPEKINQSQTVSDLQQQYLNAVKRLALEKMRNDILFEGKLGATMRNLSSLGMDISRERMISDIQKEIDRQRMSFDLDFDRDIQRNTSSIDFNKVLVTDDHDKIIKVTIQNTEETQEQVEQLKNNLGSIFGSIPIQESKTEYYSSTIPREPAMQSPTQNSTIYSQQQPAPIQEQKSQEISAEQQQVKEAFKKSMEWAAKQPNEPKYTYTGDLNNLPSDAKNNIIQYLESKNQVKIAEIDNVYQEGKYYVIDAKDSEGRFVGAELLENNFMQLVGRKPNVEENSMTNEVNSQRIKSNLITQILQAMDPSELQFIPLPDIKKRMEQMSIDELQNMLATYSEQNVQSESIQSGMHR